MTAAAASISPATEPAPLRGAALAVGAIALSLATFMNVLDTSIANVSIPAISGDLGVSPDQGTWVITSFGVANAISLPLTGWLTRRFGQVRLFTWSIGLFAMACFFVPLITLSLSGMSPDRIPAASGLFNFARITAGSFGTSIVTTFWDRRATLHHARLIEHLTATDPATAQSLATVQAGGLGPDQGVPLLNRLVDSQAFMLSADDIFYASAVLFLVLVGLIWLARPTPRASVAAETLSAAH